MIIFIIIIIIILVERPRQHTGAPYLIAPACVSSETHNLQRLFRLGGTPLYRL